jgi:hypothetical protein
MKGKLEPEPKELRRKHMKQPQCQTLRSCPTDETFQDSNGQTHRRKTGLRNEAARPIGFVMCSFWCSVHFCLFCLSFCLSFFSFSVLSFCLTCCLSFSFFFFLFFLCFFLFFLFRLSFFLSFVCFFLFFSFFLSFLSFVVALACTISCCDLCCCAVPNPNPCLSVLYLVTYMYLYIGRCSS